MSSSNTNNDQGPTDGRISTDDFVQRETSLRGWSSHFQQSKQGDDEDEALASEASTRLDAAFPNVDMTAGGRLLAFNMAQPGERGYEAEWPTKVKSSKGVDEGQKRLIVKLPVRAQQLRGLLLPKNDNAQGQSDATNEPINQPARSGKAAGKRRKQESPTLAMAIESDALEGEEGGTPVNKAMSSKAAVSGAIKQTKQASSNASTGDDADGKEGPATESDVNDAAEDAVKDSRSLKRKATTPGPAETPSKKLKSSAPEPTASSSSGPSLSSFKAVQAYPDTATDDEILAGDFNRLRYWALYQVLQTRTNSQVAKTFNDAHEGQGLKAVGSQQIGDRVDSMFKYIAADSKRAVEDVKAEFKQIREQNGVRDMTGRGNRKGQKRQVQGG